MTTRLLGAALAVALSICLSAPAHADIIVLRDGSVLGTKHLKKGEVPSLDMLRKSGKGNATLKYSVVKYKSKQVSAAQVFEVFTTEAAQNTDYNDGETYAASGDFEGAAHKFSLAAAELEGADKQLALYRRMLALRAGGGNVANMMKAADELIAAFPDGYYVPEAQDLRARILISKGKAKEAKAALEGIANASGMNARDKFGAQLTLLDWFDLRGAGRDAKKLQSTETKYRNLERQAKTAGNDARLEALRARVGAGTCVVRRGEFAAARKDFEFVTNDNTVHDKTLLGRAYHGLGDSIYGQAKADLASASGDKAKIEAAKELLETAALHYHRVTDFYGNEFAADNVIDCTTNLARVYANQFSLGDGADCQKGWTAWRYYVQAANSMNRGETKNQLVKEAKAFRKDLEAACPRKKK